MHIGHVKIRGFRSLSDISANLAEYTCLIGKNDCGKSSFLRALQLLFDPDSTPSSDDVCKIGAPPSECYIEAELHGYSPDDKLAVNGRIRIRRLLDSVAAAWQFLGKVPKSDTLKSMSEGDLTKISYQADTDLSKNVLEIVNGTLSELTPSGKVPKDTWQEAFRRLVAAGLVEYEEGWCSFEKEMLPDLVQVVMLDAYARAEEEITDGSRSVFGRVGGLLVREATDKHPGLQKALVDLRTEIDSIGTRDEDGNWQLEDLNHLDKILDEEIRRFDERVKPKSSLLPPKIPTFEFRVQIEVSDNWVTGLNRMGHGLRRSVVFAMLRTLRRLREYKASTTGGIQNPALPVYLFLIEEPELYLHPQAERRRMRELQELSKLVNAQVVLCTHSAFFVDLNQYRGIIRFERPDREYTLVRQWSGPDLDVLDKKTLETTYYFDPTRAAMLFADQVILVEGQTEKVTVPPLAERMGLTTLDVEVVDCGGIGNIPTYQRILEQFQIRYVAWMDSKEKTEVAKAKKVMTSANGRVVLTDGDWERMAKLPKNGDKGYNSWKKYVYDATPPTKQMSARIAAAYNWQDYMADPPSNGVLEQNDGQTC